jgi:hypothetical protein
MPEPSHQVVFPPELTKLRIFTSGEIDNEKVSLSLGDGMHYTLHFGSKSKVMDVHLKDEATGEYTRLVGIPHFTLMRAFVYLHKHFKTGLRRYFLGNRINLGKLNRHNCVLVKVGGEEKLLSSFVKEKRKGRYSKSYKFSDTLDKETYKSLFLLPKDIFNTDCGYFDVFKIKRGHPRKIGNVFKDPRRPGSRNLFFVSRENWRMFQAVIDLSVMTAVDNMKFEGQAMIQQKVRATMGKRYAGTSIIRRLKDDIKKRPTNGLKPVWKKHSKNN